MDRVPTWPVAAGSLVAGFAVAQATGVRPLGGLVLLAGAGWCGLRWRATVGPARTAGLVGLYVGAFVLSHVIADSLGAWGSVAAVSSVVGAATYVVVDRRGAAGAPAPAR